jgi:hypothetical protein
VEGGCTRLSTTSPLLRTPAAPAAYSPRLPRVTTRSAWTGCRRRRFRSRRERCRRWRWPGHCSARTGRRRSTSSSGPSERLHTAQLRAMRAAVVTRAVPASLGRLRRPSPAARDSRAAGGWVGAVGLSLVFSKALHSELASQRFRPGLEAITLGQCVIAGALSYDPLILP